MRATLNLFLLLSLLTGVVYPLAVTAIAAVAFPAAAGGGLMVVDGKVRGAERIGQSFDRPEYLWGRLSATSPVPYTAFDAKTSTGSTGSNHGPLHPALREQAMARVEKLHATERALGLAADRRVPIDLVTASGSGLDPDISLAAADYQLERIARARLVSVHVVRAIVQAHTKGRALGLFGEPVVPVLAVNLALDRELGRSR